MKFQTWGDALNLCFDQVPPIAKFLPLNYWRQSPDWQERVTIVFADEQRLRPKIEATIRKFCERGILPPPADPIESFLLAQRFQCACDLTEVLLIGDLVPFPHGKADSEILAWLLIQTWNDWRWDTWLKLQANSTAPIGGGEKSAGIRP